MPPSRRLANYAFFTWILAYNLTILSFFLITDLIVIHLQSKTKSKMKGSRTKSSKDSVKAPETSTLYRCPNFVKAVDHNPLFFFLLANLLTGLINITVETINTEDNTAVLIIFIYQAVLAIVVTCLYRCNIKLKCWWYNLKSSLIRIHALLNCYGSPCQRNDSNILKLLIAMLNPVLVFTGHLLCLPLMLVLWQWCNKFHWWCSS